MKINISLVLKKMPEFDILNEERFYSNILSSTHENKCWEWGKSTNNWGYGVFSYKGKLYASHRVAYFLHYKIDPEYLKVCHTCDNPKCCNPKHLFLGTDADNKRDSISKGRASFDFGGDGLRGGKRKLTEEVVSDIYKEYHSSKISYTKIAKKYNTNSGTVYDIVSGKGWKHITSQIKN